MLLVFGGSREPLAAHWFIEEKLWIRESNRLG